MAQDWTDILATMRWPQNVRDLKSETGTTGDDEFYITEEGTIFADDDDHELSSLALTRESSWAAKSALSYRSDCKSGGLLSASGKNIKINSRTTDSYFLSTSTYTTQPPVPPLTRFRRAVKVVQILLKATRNNRQGQRPDLLSWTQYHDDHATAKRAYDLFGVSFDPSIFKATREVQLSHDAVTILSLDPSERTDEQLKVALLALNQTVEAFSEFPIKMQKSLVRVGWYEQFEAKRVIIRQGHMADNFYFILSGTAVVTLLETNKETGEECVRTVAFLNKGNSFGELALMHGAKRSATVTCKSDVSLLAVGREDFIDIFMHVEKDKEPDHIRFLRTIDLFKGWPLEKLPYDNPKICLFTYFRRGVLLCKDSNAAEWVYIVKTGTCRVLKSLTATRPNIKGLVFVDYSKESVTKLPPISQAKSSSMSSSPRTEHSDTSWSKFSDISRQSRSKRSSLPPLHVRSNGELAAITEEHQRTIDEVFEKRHTFKKNALRDDNQEEETQASKRRKMDTVFVQIQKLGPKETFGLENIAFSMIRKTTGCSLVSDGAECILINKKFFQQHLTEEVAKRIRRIMQPIPTEDSLQQKLQNKTNWEAYKTMTVSKYMVYRKHLHEYESLFY